MVLVQVPDARDRQGNLLVVIIGAHYRTKAVSQEEILLHAVQVCCSFSLNDMQACSEGRAQRAASLMQCPRHDGVAR